MQHLDKANETATNAVTRKSIPLFWPYVSPRAVQALQGVLETRWIGQGPLVDRVEDLFRFQFDVPNAVAVNSCTSALHLALILAGVQEGDEVITTPLTCYATITPILYQRARPVFADINPTSLNIDPESIKTKITNRTKAILVVHWGGEPCDMDDIRAIASKSGIPVIADAAHALGAVYRGRKVGGFANFSCFSFQAIKQITTGDGGMLTCLDREDAEKARRLRWFGVDRNFQGDIYEKFQIHELGYKYQMNDLTASLLIVQLEELAQVLQRRREIVTQYRTGLRNFNGIELLDLQHDRESAHWLFTVLVDRRRGDFQRKLAAAGIETSLVHIRCDCYPILGGKRQDLPTMNAIEPRYLSLPLHHKLTPEDIGYIVKTIREGW